jgi:hypothetical protein
MPGSLCGVEKHRLCLLIRCLFGGMLWWHGSFGGFLTSGARQSGRINHARGTETVAPPSAICPCDGFTVGFTTPFETALDFRPGNCVFPFDFFPAWLDADFNSANMLANKHVVRRF